jgi:hypothetical protein
VNQADDAERIPRSIGGLIAFALRSWAAYAPLYLALTAGVFAAYAIAEYAVAPAGITTPQGQFKLYVLQYTGLFADALVVAAVALGVAARSGGANVPPREIMGAAIERWLPIIAVTFLVQTVVGLTIEFGGFVPAPEPHALVFVTAPLVWILWGVLGLAGPYVALGSDRAALLVVGGFGRAFTLALRRKNLLRLCALALISIVPNVAQALLQNAFVQHHVPRPIFWSSVPVDVLTVALLAAVQTAFALDFARRAADAQRSA